jgi:hypothetical protein
VGKRAAEQVTGAACAHVFFRDWRAALALAVFGGGSLSTNGQFRNGETERSEQMAMGTPRSGNRVALLKGRQNSLFGGRILPQKTPTFLGGVFGARHFMIMKKM